LPEGAQSPARRYILEARDSNVGKREKQDQHQEQPNSEHLKRDAAALIRYERSAAHKPISTGANRGHDFYPCPKSA
jgi:hypothetical protein